MSTLPDQPSTTAASCPALQALVQYLDSLDSRADLEILAGLLERLDVTRADLKPACIFDHNAYRRNTIKRSDWYELVALCWHSGQRTPIHDHRGSSCGFRVIEGVATETRFARTPSGLICPMRTDRLEAGYVCAAADADIHQVLNAEAEGTDLVTLHIYSPPMTRYHRYTLDSPSAESQVEIRELNSCDPGAQGI